MPPLLRCALESWFRNGDLPGGNHIKLMSPVPLGIKHLSNYQFNRTAIMAPDQLVRQWRHLHVDPISEVSCRTKS